MRIPAISNAQTHNAAKGTDAGGIGISVDDLDVDVDNRGLFGAELNSEIEHQTAADSTAGPEKPLGSRGAEMADTLGASR